MFCFCIHPILNYICTRKASDSTDGSKWCICQSSESVFGLDLEWPWPLSFVLLNIAPPPQLIVLCLCPGCPLDGPLVFRLLTSESVHLFLEYRVHNFNKRRTNGRMDAWMDGWTNGQSDKRTYWEHYVTGRGIKTYKFKTTFTQVKQHKSISQWFFF